MNNGYEWVVDLDIEKYFDTVNHDKLISILRERINDAPTLHLIRSFLKAGVMEDAAIRQGNPHVHVVHIEKELPIAVRRELSLEIRSGLAYGDAQRTTAVAHVGTWRPRAASHRPLCPQ